MTEGFPDLASTAQRSWLLEAIKVAGYYSGLLWLTPFVGTTDHADLQHLRGSILRDIAWISSLRPAEGSSLALTSKRLDAVVNAVTQPWHAQAGWTDYGAIRLELLVELPDKARAAALAELRNMEVLVLPGNRDKWKALADDVKTDLALADPKAHDRVPHALQELWREVDFGRARRARGNAKHATVARLTWSLVAAITILVTITLNQSEHGEPRPWLVTVFGLLGGSVSALRSVNMAALPERRSLEVEAITLRLRPVVGAMAALIVYVIGHSGILFQIIALGPHDAGDAAPIEIHVGADGVRWTYYTLAFLAGFSERLFLGMLYAIERTTATKGEAPTPATATTGEPPK